MERNLFHIFFEFSIPTIGTFMGFVGIILYGYIYFKLYEESQLITLSIGILAFIFSSLEFINILISLSNYDNQAGFYLYRAEQFVLSLTVIPWMIYVKSNLELNENYHKALDFLYHLSIFLITIIIVIGIVYPQSFISRTETITTLNETITIPLSKLEGITYWEETSLKKVLSLNINDFTCIDINVLLMSNYEEIANAINKYIANREKVGNHNTIRYNYKEESTHITELDKRIKVKTSNDYILLMIVLMAIEGITVFSFFAGYHDIITITAIIVIPLIMLKLLPYKIYFYGDRIEYKHIIHTRNRIETIFLKDISYSEIVTKTLTATTYNNRHRKQNKVKYYTLNIYKKDNDTISLNLLYEKMGDVKQIVDIINSQDIRK